MQARLTLSVHDLEVRYEGKTALTIPHLSVAGSSLMILGHNGSGKSTLLKAILRLLPWTKGSVSVLDEGGIPLLPHDSLAFCPENGAVFHDIPVERYLELWSRIKYSDPLYYKKQGRELLTLMEIDSLLGAMGRELSKGQRRRVQIAVCFLLSPRVILFDEPFDGLDIQQTEHLLSVMRQRSESTSYIISTHRMDVVERAGDALVVLAGGSPVASGSPAEVVSVLSPDQPRTLGEAMGEHLRRFSKGHPR